MAVGFEKRIGPTGSGSLFGRSRNGRSKIKNKIRIKNSGSYAVLLLNRGRFAGEGFQEEAQGLLDILPDGFQSAADAFDPARRWLLRLRLFGLGGGFSRR